MNPWEVYLADLDPIMGHEQGGKRPVLIISSSLHLRAMGGRSVMIVPITSKFRQLTNRVEITNPKGERNWVITEQIRFISTQRFVRSTPWWTLTNDEIANVQRAMKAMVAF